MWAPQVEALAREFRVIAPDLRGHGRTTSPEDPSEYGIRRYAKDIVGTPHVDYRVVRTNFTDTVISALKTLFK